MKHISLTIGLLLLISMNFSFAADENRNSVTVDQSYSVENPQLMPENDNVLTETEKKHFKKDALRRKALKRFIKKSKKFKQNEHSFMPNKVNALIVIGFLLLLPGMILAILGVALIPAIILAVVGGTLWVIGLIKMKNSM